MENNENSLGECPCMCGKGILKVFSRIFDNGHEGIEHLWKIDCIHCQRLLKSEGI
jgi:hypothetical protein